MKSLVTLTSLCLLASSALAQPSRSEDRYFEGVNLSLGAATAQSKTQGASANSGFAQAKVNYTFALSHPVKLGLTATADLGNARLSATETWAAGNLSEVSLEPGILLISNGLLYAKIGTHRGQYETAGAARSFSGSATGLGYKHFVHGSTFLQIEFTQRRANNVFITTNTQNFTQNTGALLLGTNF